MTAGKITGGCQCGAVRYRIESLGRSSICHCRMCQKAFGGFFGPLVTVNGIEWTRGERGIFHSSQTNWRGFCRECGTPLTFAYDHSKHIAVSIGSLDHPEIVMPEQQYGIEARLPAFNHLHELKGSRTEDDVPVEMMAKLRSRQHPDHD